MLQMRLKEFISNDLEQEDFVICEIGGTIGDIESLPFRSYKTIS